MPIDVVRFADLFAGAGGTTYGASRVPGVVPTFAANHWAPSVRCHAEAFPTAHHVIADLNSVRPARYPQADAEILAASPVCKPWSRGHSARHNLARAAQAGKPVIEVAGAEESNRATPWAVLDWVEQFAYPYVVVENVAELAWRWPHFHTWATAIAALGYQPPQLLSLDAAFFGAACHRNRLFTVFTRTDHTRPDFTFAPAATCAGCGHTGGAQQVFRPGRTSGNWGVQYDYRCAACAQVVVPSWHGVGEVIDTTLPWPTVGERPRPLAPATLDRIAEGLRRFGPGGLRPATGFVVGNYGVNSRRQARGVTLGGTWWHWADPMGTITTSDSHFVAAPPEGAGPARTDRQRARLLEQTRYRYLTSGELAAAIGLPADYPLPNSDKDRRVMIGNMVAPAVMTAIVERIVEALASGPARLSA